MTVTTETICADLRGEATSHANMCGSSSNDRAQRYRGLTFEPVSEQEFRAQDPASADLSFVLMVTDTVESRAGLEFIEHFEGDGKVLIFWRQK